MTALTPPMTTDTTVFAFPGASRAMSRDSPQVLADLRDAMNLAQVAVMQARRPPATAVQLTAARGDYLAAMLVYQRALIYFRLPVPPRLRDEARLLRRLVAPA